MSLTPQERQNDLLLLKRLAIEKDLRKLEAMPQDVLDQDLDAAMRHRLLKDHLRKQIAALQGESSQKVVDIHKLHRV